MNNQSKLNINDQTTILVALDRYQEILRANIKGIQPKLMSHENDDLYNLLQRDWQNELERTQQAYSKILFMEL